MAEPNDYHVEEELDDLKKELEEFQQEPFENK